MDSNKQSFLSDKQSFSANKIKIIIVGIILYLVAIATSYLVFSKLVFSKTGETLVTSPIPEPKKGEGGRAAFDENLPKTEACPLNGALYSKQQREWWEKHRPLGVMIENHQESRPQSGLSFADVVYEAVAEGGVTRFLAVYYCQDAGIVGAVRSARTYFVDFISEYGSYPLYAHVGGANAPGPADALSQIEAYGWQSYNDLNQFSIGFPVFWRDYERLGHPVATEHTMYSTTEKLWKEAATRGLTNVDKKGKSWDEDFTQYKFKEDASNDARPASGLISFTFWESHPEYSVRWEYDKTSNAYLRVNGGEKHLDFNNKQQLNAKNVVVLFMREQNASDGYEGNIHLLYGTQGRGRALIFMDGKRIDGTWTKKDRASRTAIIDAQGREMEFNRGVIWFEILPTGTTIDVK